VALETTNDKTIAAANSMDFIACSRCVFEEFGYLMRFAHRRGACQKI
jgi:hypothetical protein